MFYNKNAFLFIGGNKINFNTTSEQQAQKMATQKLDYHITYPTTYWNGQEKVPFNKNYKSTVDFPKEKFQKPLRRCRECNSDEKNGTCSKICSYDFAYKQGISTTPCKYKSHHQKHDCVVKGAPVSLRIIKQHPESLKDLTYFVEGVVVSFNPGARIFLVEINGGLSECDMIVSGITLQKRGYRVPLSCFELFL